VVKQVYTFITGYQSHPKKGSKRTVFKADTRILEPSTYHLFGDKKFLYYQTVDPSKIQLLTPSGTYTPRKASLAHTLEKQTETQQPLMTSCCVQRNNSSCIYIFGATGVTFQALYREGQNLLDR